MAFSAVATGCVCALAGAAPGPSAAGPPGRRPGRCGRRWHTPLRAWFGEEGVRDCLGARAAWRMGRLAPCAVVAVHAVGSTVEDI